MNDKSKIAYTLTRTRRKTVSIRVRDGEVFVTAPLGMAPSEVDGFVAAKEKWIREKTEISKAQAAQREAFRLEYEGTILYRGREYPITAAANGESGFDGEKFFMPPNLTAEEIKEACISIYKALAARLLTERTAYFSERMGVTPTGVRINSAKYRWGSCSSKGRINFSWRLIMAEDEAIDYVIVHELAHMMEMNHSHRFWLVVEAVLPDYPRRIRYLDELQRRLICERW